jgi:hypothetical protein
MAKELENMIVKDLKMDCYNADSVHGFDDVMSITDKLAKADYYIMIDLRREVDAKNELPLSVFTHQEFALARAWKLDKMLVFQEEGLDSCGMLSYVLAHPIKFFRSNLVDTVRETIRKDKWESSYSRNLVASEIKQSDTVRHADHTGQFTGRIWQLTIENHRRDKAAVNTVVVLNSVRSAKEMKDIPFFDRSYLKWTDQVEGYEHTILPENRAAVDIFAIRVGERGIFLLSRHDYSPRSPIVKDVGEYIFEFHIYSANFPLLKVPVRINYTGPMQMTVIDTATTAEFE